MMTLRHQPSISRNFGCHSETDEIKIYFNSNGGSVDQGTAIYNMLQQHGSYKTGIVMGGCHSIAFTILQACDKRIMGQGTTAVIHDIWETVTGNAADLRGRSRQSGCSNGQLCGSVHAAGYGFRRRAPGDDA